MSKATAGRKGGQTTLRRYGHEFFRDIGKQGGSKGGNATKRKYGSGHFRKIGRKGGMG